MRYKVFDVATMDGNERKRETAILYWSTDDNPYYMLHRLGVEYAMSPEGHKLRNVGLTYGELFEHLTPELLAPLGMQIVWPDREATHLEDDRQIVSCYEIQSHLEARTRERQRGCQRENRVKETAERYARKLEHLKASAHPAISTWAPDVIVSRAISWAYQFVRNHNEDGDADAFFEVRLKDAKPHKVRETPTETASEYDGENDEQNIPQTA